MDKYLTPKGCQSFQLEIKRSRFITTVALVQNRVGAKSLIQSVREEYPDANHHCWAMVAGRPDDIYQQDQSDDGEPKGTAGKPMLNVLQHSGLGNTVVVVTRYFGGVKLGAGGLVRAYTQSVSSALEQLVTQTTFVMEALLVAMPYSMLNQLEHWLQTSNCLIAEKSFNETVNLVLHVPASEKAGLLGKLEELGQGKISIKSNAVGK